MVTERSFGELNLWQRIFAEHWDEFVAGYAEQHGRSVPENWHENVVRMLSCGDIAEGYYEYYCQGCGTTKKVGFTCKSRLCLRCFKVAVDDWLKQAKSVLFEGVVHRQVVLTLPKAARPLVMAERRFLKIYMDAGATAVKDLIEQWRPKRKIRVGIMAVLQLHGRSGNRNPHLHFVVSEGGVDKNRQWRNVDYFDTRKLRKTWQYQVITALKKAVRGTRYEAEWSGKLGSMFRKYPAGFDCDCMPEKGPVDRLVVYLCKYVSSPPISIRRIEDYDGLNVTYRYKDHRRGEVRETISAVDFIGRMIRHLPPKGFRMVRYYGIYARPIREKIHAMVSEALALLVRRAERMARYFAGKAAFKDKLQKRSGFVRADEFAKKPMSCPHCGSTDMLLIRIWTRASGVVYELLRDGLRDLPLPESKVPAAPATVQLTFAF